MSSSSKSTVREVETALAAGGKFKKGLVGDFYDYPFIPITASTFKTGKHGHAKTRLLIKDYFTELTYSILRDSDEVVEDMEHDLRYGLFEGVVSQVSKDKIIVLTPDYELVEVKESEKKVSVDDSVLVEYFKGPKLMYKLKSVLNS